MARKTHTYTTKIFGDDVVVKEQYYLNNRALPTKDSEYEFTPKMAEAFARAEKDICYFAETFFTIINKTKREIIKLRDYQKKFLKSMVKNNRIIMLTARQASKTTMMTIYALWLAMFHPDNLVAVLAHKNAQALEILARIDLAYSELPGWIKEPVKEHNKTSIVFENGSKIITSPTSDAAIRGQSISCLMLDEFAFVEPGMADKFWTSVTPTLAENPNAKLFIASTPNGVGNIFWELAEMARLKKNDFKLHKIIWSDVPGRDAKWRKKTLETDCKGDLDKFQQEYECKFLGSSNSPFSDKVFEQLEADVKDPVAMLDDGRMSIYEWPQENRIYSIGVDVAEGIGSDASVINVFDLTDLSDIHQVAMWWDNMIDTTSFAEKVYEVAYMYGLPVLGVERNGCGTDTCNRLFYDKHYPRFVNYGMHASAHQSNFRPGIISNVNTKTPAINNMKYWVCDKWKAHVHDRRFLEEMRHFERNNNNKWGAANGFHDDIVMSVTWALNVLHRNVINDHFIVDKVSGDGKPINIFNKFRYTLPKDSDLLSNKVKDCDTMPVMIYGRYGANIYGSANDATMEALLQEGWEIASNQLFGWWQ